jgi:hypothetical protein
MLIQANVQNLFLLKGLDVIIHPFRTEGIEYDDDNGNNDNEYNDDDGKKMVDGFRETKKDKMVKTKKYEDENQ